MAEFDPDAFLKSTSKKTDAPSKGFDPDAFLGKTSTVKQEAKQPATQPSQPTSTSAFGTFAREAGLNVPATMAGIGAGEAATAATAPVLGPAAPVAGLVVGGAVGFGVNYLGEAGMDELEAMGPVAQKIMQTLGVDKATRTAGRKEHEYAALAGQLASGGPFMSTAAKNVGQRVVGGGINVGVGAGSRAAFGEDQDIKKSAMEFAAGAAMPGTLSKTGERIPGVRKTEPTTPTKKPTTPEEVDTFKAKVKEETAKRDATAPLVEAAIRNKETGEIERMGPKHDLARKAETIDTHDQGFVDERGNFHERQAAVDQAKRAGQISEDHVLENPPGELPGLHSGDLRKAGDERFAVTEEQPADIPKEEIKTPSSADELATKTSEPVAEEFKKVDPRSVPNEEEMVKHATDIHDRFGEEEAVKFFEDYQKNLNERAIPVPNNTAQLDDMLHKMNTYITKDRSEHVVGYEENTVKGVTPEERAKWFDMRERGEELPPEGKAILDAIDAENIALVRKAKGMGLDVGEEFATGQSRIRLFSEKEKPGWKETLKKFFNNETPMGDKMAEQADAAIERKVYQTDDGRVIEFARQPKDVVTPKGTIKQGTQIFEWKNGQKRLIGSSDDINFKRGDKFIATDGKELTVVDGKVPAIEQNSPYRYWHDAEASARMANMGLRKMVREAEAIENLKKSELFKQIGHGPEQDLKELPKHWVVPSNIDRIPQLRGWHFDPKAAAIISDFAKVWDNSMYMKLSNAIVKNMMLNPIPHMFNEVMHLWNARGFTGWVDPRRLGTFAETSRAAWRDVGGQTQFYRDIMREGGSILGADPRNKNYFEPIIKEAQKQMFETPEMQRSLKQLAKKLGTSVGNLYNSISTASNKAMWFTRDVMYVQLIREIMKQNPNWSLKESIDHAERHMPNYRLPSEVLGSRALSQVLRDPRVSMFSRYHYGMVKSLVNTVKDINPKNLSTPEGRAQFREGVDSMLAIGVAMGIMYPLMDKMAEAMFGEGAEQRRAGPYHMIQAAMDVGAGKKDASALIWPVFTFNPMLLTLAQLGFNKKIFTGKQIYHPEDDLRDKASDVGKYLVGQVPQASPVMSATSGEEGGTTKLIARQLDIKAKTEAEKAREKRAKELQARTKKSRDTKRERKEYIP